ncbi:MAG TPA: ferritin family protein [Geobacteraceae bacterium]
MFSTIARTRMLVLLVPLVLFAAALAISAEEKYPETIIALNGVYLDESRAQVRYTAFARKAQEEGYPLIAYFFKALSVSEAIHAKNARDVLCDLGSPPRDEEFEPEVDTTRENLKFATTFEINIIENVFPDYLKKITPENHEQAICSLTNELETERQHLDLLKKIQRGTGAFFGMLAKRFEGTPVDYFICQVCGATTIERPVATCPVCKADASRYMTVAKTF